MLIYNIKYYNINVLTDYNEIFNHGIKGNLIQSFPDFINPLIKLSYVNNCIIILVDYTTSFSSNFYSY